MLILKLMKNRKPFNSAWVIVATSFIILALVYGIFHSFSVFFVAIIKELAWSHSVTSGAFSLFVIVLSLIGPFIGGMIDKFDPRKVFLFGSLFLGIGLFLCSFIQFWWQLYLFFGIITAIGVGSTGWIPHTTIIQHWFKENRGLAIGIISSGVGIGIFLCIPLIQYLINQVGWRMTYRIISFSIPLIIICLTVAFIKPIQKNAHFSITKEIKRNTKKDPLVIDEEWASQLWTVRQAIIKKQFWLISLSIFLSFFIIQSILTHQVAFFVDKGLQASTASYIVGIVGIVSVGGKILWGTLSDKMGREVVYLIGNAFLIFGIGLLILFSLFHSTYIPYVYGIVFSIGYSVPVALSPLITADFFEGANYGRIFGTIQILSGLGASFGAWFAGLFFDLLGSYTPFLLILIPLVLFSSISVWWAAPRKIRTVPGKIK
jgi:MFS family permease